jgi:hypothetical protein
MQDYGTFARWVAFGDPPLPPARCQHINSGARVDAPAADPPGCRLGIALTEGFRYGAELKEPSCAAADSPALLGWFLEVLYVERMAP